MSLPFHRLPAFSFGLALFAFLLPFVSFSCAGGTVTMTGLQLATGSVPSELASMGMASQELQARDGYSGDALTLLAGIVGLAGFAATFGAGNFLRRAAIGLAALGAVSLAASRANMLVSALREGHGLVTVQYQMGFWLAFLCFGLAIATGILAGWNLPWKRVSTTEPVPIPERV